MSDRISATSTRPPAPLQLEGSIELRVSGGIYGGLTTYSIGEDLDVVRTTSIRDRDGGWRTHRETGRLDAEAGAALVRYLPAALRDSTEKPKEGTGRVVDDQHFVVTVVVDGKQRTMSFDGSTATFFQRRLAGEIMLESGEAIRERPHPDLSSLLGW